MAMQYDGAMKEKNNRHHPGKTRVRQISGKVIHPPGEGRYQGESLRTECSGRLIRYDERGVSQQDFALHSPLPPAGETGIHWLQINGLAAVKPIEALCHQLRLHPLSIEDIFNTYHPAKFEELPEYILFISKCFHYDPVAKTIESHHIAIVLRDNLLVSFQDGQPDLFSPIVQRIENGQGRIRKMPIDYLFYRLVDLLIDQNFLTIDAMWETADTLDQSIMNQAGKQTAADIQQLKREMILFMKSLRPIRRSVFSIAQTVSPLFKPETRLFFRDLQDHVVEIGELTETLYAYLIESHNLYLSVLGQKTNEAMKILTAIATIFIPLTFLVGVYGMNFRFMPELDSPLAYPLLWGVMIVIAALMVRYFRRHRWF